jgi:hypothetical protein
VTNLLKDQRRREKERGEKRERERKGERNTHILSKNNC